MAVEAGDIIWRIIGDIEGLNTAMADAQKQAEARFGQISRTAGVAMTAVGAAITGAMAVSTAKAVEFGGAMAEISTLGVKDLGGLEEAIKDVTAEFGLGLTDAAKAAYQAISAGASEAQAPLLLEQAAKAATAGVSDLTTAIGLGTSVSNAFGQSIDDVGTIFDQSFIAVKNGVTTFNELGASVGQLAPTMAAAGLQTDEMFASITALTKAGIQTSVAATNMKAVMTGIIKPTSDAQKVAEELGIEFNLAGLQSMGLAGFMEHLAEKTGGNVETMGKLFGSAEALGAVLALTGTQAESFNATLNEMRETTGAADTAFAKIVENDPGFAWRQLKAEMEVLAVTVGQALLPALAGILELMTPFIQAVAQAAREHPGLTQAVVLLAAAIGGILTVVGPLLIMLPGLMAAWSAIVPVFTAVGAAAAALVAALSLPVWAIAAIVAAVAAAAVAVVAYWEPISEFFSTMWDGIVSVFQAGWEYISGIISQIGAALSQLFGMGGGVDVGMGEPVPAFASGGTMPATGWAMVGEQGPELVQLPGGSRVHSTADSAGMMSGSTTNLTVNFGRDSVRSDEDIAEIERRLADLVGRRLQGRGVAL